MKKKIAVLCILLLLGLLAGCAGMELLPPAAPLAPTSTVAAAPAVSPGPALSDTAALLERVYAEYDPAAGAMGAKQWCTLLLNAGADTDGFCAAAEELIRNRELDVSVLEAKLSTLHTMARRVYAADSGLMRDPSVRSAFPNAGEVETLFASLYRGFGLDMPPV